jgi:membrane-associated phospholipid phosphatase
MPRARCWSTACSPTSSCGTARARWHLPVATLALATIVFVGASRVLLQVHWFSDVLAGWANAAAWAALCIAALEAVRLAAHRTDRAARSARAELFDPGPRLGHAGHDPTGS